MKFSALNADINSASFDPLGSRSPPYKCIKFGVTPSKRANYAIVHQCSKRTVIDRHRLAAYHNKHSDELSGGTNNDDPERP